MEKKRNHPKGLMTLFFTEMWERFGFYLMLGIFTLYMVAGEDAAFPGLGLSRAEAASIYGTYLALVYLTPFFGGLIADRLIGYRKSIVIGGLLMAAGYLSLAIQGSFVAFGVGLGLIILGNGLFKPNISVLLGRLYENDEYKDKKDAGFNIFYLGINIGAFVCNFVAAYLRLQYGWGIAFAAAGIGMIVGVVWFLYGLKIVPNLSQVDTIEKTKEGEESVGKTITKLFVPALIAGIVGWLIPGTLFGSDATDAFLFFCIPVVIFYINVWKNANEKEKQPIAALLAVMGLVVIFWAVFHQNGSALTYWAQNNTNRELNVVTKAPLSALKLTEEVSTVPREIKKVGPHGEDLGTEISEKGSYYFSNYQGELPKGNVHAVPQDMIAKYREQAKKEFANNDEWTKLPEEKRLELTEAEWQKIPQQERDEYGVMHLWPTELQASINPFFIIILTPVVVAFFTFLARRKREPSTPAKITWGLFITAISMSVMVAAAILSDSGAVKASAGWLFGIYGVITIGELCLSPMGLSFVSKLSPKHLSAVMMGGWFLSTAIGNKLSGVLSGLWDFFPKKEHFFLLNMGLTLLCVVGLVLILPWLKRVVKEYE